MNQHTPRDIASFPELFDGIEDLSLGLRRLALTLIFTLGIPGALLSLYAVIPGS